jgi:hypothetical protein
MKQLLLVLVLFFTGWRNVSAVELIADPEFQDGFGVKDRNGKEISLQWDKSHPSIWEIGQHFTKSSLADPAHIVYRPDGFDFDDGYARLSAHPAGMDADLIMGVNADHEYGGVYRKDGDPWPHEYISQSISKLNGDGGTTLLSLASLRRVDLSLQARLLYDHAHQGPGYDPRIHAGTFNLLLTVQNLNHASKGYGDYYWFGMAIYDSRVRLTTLKVMKDQSSAKKKGTGKNIYNIGLAPFTQDIVADGQWVKVDGDLLPYLLAGLRASWAKGFLTGSTDLADYYLGSVFLGWEITGLNDASIALKGLGMTATPK